jgi:hypothetical protein
MISYFIEMYIAFESWIAAKLYTPPTFVSQAINEYLEDILPNIGNRNNFANPEVIDPVPGFDLVNNTPVENPIYISTPDKNPTSITDLVKKQGAITQAYDTFTNESVENWKRAKWQTRIILGTIIIVGICYIPILAPMMVIPFKV